MYDRRTGEKHAMPGTSPASVQGSQPEAASKTWAHLVQVGLSRLMKHTEARVEKVTVQEQTSHSLALTALLCV